MENKTLVMIIAVIGLALIAYVFFGGPQKEGATDVQEGIGESVNTQAESGATEKGMTSQPATAQPTRTTGGSSPAVQTGGTAFVPGKDVVVLYTNSGFSPASVLVEQGKSVTFVNQSDVRAMRVMTDDHPFHVSYQGFTQPRTVGKGGEFTFTFTRTGAWTYHNENELSHTGTVLVSPQVR